MENKERCFGELSITELMHCASDQVKALVTESVEEPDVSEDSLSHHGIKNMKWGVRRFQNRDGSLTPAGKKRYSKELSKVREAEKVLKNKQATKSKIEKLGERQKAVVEGEKEIEGFYGKDKSKKATKSSKPTNAAAEKKAIKDMSDDELRKAKTRLELERDYLKVYNELNPKKVSAGKEFVKKLGKNLGDAAAEATKNAGKAFMEKTLKDMLGVPDNNNKDGNNSKNNKNNNKNGKNNESAADKELAKLESRLAKLQTKKKIYETKRQIDAMEELERNNYQRS